MQAHNKNNIAGKRFGRWTVIREAGKQAGKTMWNCRCDCGTEKPVNGGNLLHGKSVSCGCFKDEKTSARVRTHGKSKTRTYMIWKGMVKRCHNPGATGFYKYGARGISVCDEWRNSFEAFLKDMGECPDGMSIDRIDAAGNYEPGNCRWATDETQFYNKRNTVRFEGKTLKEWSELSGIAYGTLKRRLLKTGTIHSNAPNAKPFKDLTP